MKRLAYTCDVKGCGVEKQPSNGWWAVQGAALSIVIVPWDEAERTGTLENSLHCCGSPHALYTASELMANMREVPSGERVK